MGSTIPRQVGLGSVRKVAKCEPGSKRVSSIPLWFLFQFLCPSRFLLELLPWFLSMIVCSLSAETNAVLPKLLLVMVFFTTPESKRGQREMLCIKP